MCMPHTAAYYLHRVLFLCSFIQSLHRFSRGGAAYTICLMYNWSLLLNLSQLPADRDIRSSFISSSSSSASTCFLSFFVLAKRVEEEKKCETSRSGRRQMLRVTQQNIWALVSIDYDRRLKTLCTTYDCRWLVCQLIGTHCCCKRIISSRVTIHVRRSYKYWGILFHLVDICAPLISWQLIHSIFHLTHTHTRH